MKEEIKLLDSHQAAEKTGWSYHNLAKRRQLKLPPMYLKIGRKVFYDNEYLTNFINACVVDHSNTATQQHSNTAMLNDNSLRMEDEK